MEVQYRNPDTAVAAGNRIAPKGDAAGRTIVTGDAAAPVPVTGAVAETPPDLTAFGRATYKTSDVDPTGFEVASNVAGASRVLEILYVGLPAALGGPGPYYVVVVDKAAALVGGEASVLPTPKLTAAGDLFFWEPPDGFLFADGIKVALSSTPVIYTAVADQISTTCRTRNP